MVVTTGKAGRDVSQKGGRSGSSHREAAGAATFAVALGAVATLNADVKGEAVDPAYALERAIRRIATARAAR